MQKQIFCMPCFLAARGRDCVGKEGECVGKGRDCVGKDRDFAGKDGDDTGKRIGKGKSLDFFI